MTDKPPSTNASRCPECGVELTGSDAKLCPGCLLKAVAEPSATSESFSASPSMRASFVPPQPSELSEHLPGLEVVELLGRGGMGAVYKARQQDLDRVVAVKVLPKEVQNDPGFEERFVREAQTLAKLNHPNIVALYEFGQANDLFYFVMEFVDGVTLRETIASGGVASTEALQIVPEICEALQYAHEQGVVHRDIKPENILLDRRGRVKIADFGLAKLLDRNEEDQNLTQTHQVMGTVKYMAPEQMSTSKTVDHRADIFSLGVIFYELLTGELPMGWFAPPSKKVGVDVRIDEVVLRALESEPSRRYQHASEIKTAVEALATNAGVSAALTKGESMDTVQLHKIYDKTKSGNRLLQQLAFLGGSIMMMPIVVTFTLAVFNRLSFYLPLAFATVSVICFLLSSWLKKDQVFETTYKNHKIRIDNTSLKAERVYLDGELVQRGGIGSKMEFRFPITAGEGVGDEVVVWLDITMSSVRCRVEAEEQVGGNYVGG